MKAGRVSAIPFAQRNGKAEFNASGVVQVGPDRFVFTDNHDPAALFELVLNPDGTQREPIRRRPLSGLAPGALSDPEGLTRIDVDGGMTLVVSSSLAVRKKTVGHDGLVRVRYTRTAISVPRTCRGFATGWCSSIPNWPRRPISMPTTAASTSRVWRGIRCGAPCFSASGPR